MSQDPYAAMVRKAHVKFGTPVRSVPTVGTEQERIDRVRMKFSEAIELAHACGLGVAVSTGDGNAVSLSGARDLTVRVDPALAPDISKMAQELADNVYVDVGSAQVFGIDLLAVTREVHAANMRKEPPATSTGKWVKPPGWTPPDVDQVLRHCERRVQHAAATTYQERFLLNYVEEIDGLPNRKPDSRELWDAELVRIGIMRDPECVCPYEPCESCWRAR